MYCWPCFIPWWYKTHYASHYHSVRMPGNEMIHIQEGYLRLNFNISKQQHVIFTLEPRSQTKAFDPCSNVCSFSLRSAQCAQPLPLKMTLLLSSKCIPDWFDFLLESSCHSKSGGEWIPRFGWNIPLIMLTGLGTQGSREDPSKTCCCAKVKYEGYMWVLLVDLSFVNITFASCSDSMATQI